MNPLSILRAALEALKREPDDVKAQVWELFMDCFEKQVTEEVVEGAKAAYAMAAAPAIADTDSAWEEFKSSYPNFVNEREAREVWDRVASTHESQVKLFACLNRWRGSASWIDPKYIPYPAKWLKVQAVDNWEARPAPSGKPPATSETARERADREEKTRRRAQQIEVWRSKVAQFKRDGKPVPPEMLRAVEEFDAEQTAGETGGGLDPRVANVLKQIAS